MPHAPQSVTVAAGSQPSFPLKSRLQKPGLQVGKHAPPRQSLALVPAFWRQACPHPPQLFASLATSAHVLPQHQPSSHDALTEQPPPTAVEHDAPVLSTL